VVNNNVVTVTVNNNTGADLVLDGLFFDYNRAFGNSPKDVAVAYSAGDLDDPAPVTLYTAAGHAQGVWTDHDIWLDGLLTDRTLAAGQSASFTLTFSNASASNTRGDLDNVMVLVQETGSGNNAPTFNSNPVVEVNATEDAAYSSTIADDATDADSDPLNFSRIAGPAWLNVASDGALSGTPVNADVGLNSWSVQVSDGTDTDTATLEITVDAAPANQPPAFTADPFSEVNATENAAYSASIADDASDPESDPMTFSKVSGPAWLSVASGGSLSGTPGAGDVGLNVFTVQVDASGGSDTATLNITVDAAPVNQPPAFTVDPFSEVNATENAAYSATIADDASDPESDPMTFSKVSGPAWLSVAADGTLSGTPGAGDVGLNAFTVQVDATGGSDTATLNITVDPASSGWTVLNSEDFEGGWGIWIDGGNDCRRSANDSAYAHSGTYCVRIRDNSNSSRTTTGNIDIAAYTQLKIAFWFDSDGLSAGDGFDVKVRDASGTYQTVDTLVAGTDFTVGQQTFKEVIVTDTEVSFSSTARVRFQGTSPSNAEKVYLDDIELSVQ
jgi:hypothetical protein